jgi:trehalose 6-phosphate synthase
MEPLPRPVVVASNRGPVTFKLDEDGHPVPATGPGGLVTALAGALPGRDAVWLSAAMSPGDRAIAEGEMPDAVDLPATAEFVQIPTRQYHRYYNEISNRLLWFVYHLLWDTVRSPVFDQTTQRNWLEYEETNRIFAEALAKEPGDPAFLIQDYHLTLVPRMLRELRPRAAIAHFSHIPFPGITYFGILPTAMREQILSGMLGADVLGFQAPRWAENFLLTVRGLPDARVDLARARISYRGQETLVRVYPVSVEAGPLREIATSPDVRSVQERIADMVGGEALILRVDRLELSKNIVRGFRAFELFLKKHREWHGRVKHIALLSPSRLEIPEYQEYANECLAEAARVNHELGDLYWQPIHVSVREDRARAIAAYGLYDVLLVNPVIDGMNLVAMEGPVLNQRNGVLVLSQNAGAYGRLGKYALGVNPYDVLETAEAIYVALEMENEERARRARGLARTVLTDTPERWLERQLGDLEARRPHRRRRRSAQRAAS